MCGDVLASRLILPARVLAARACASILSAFYAMLSGVRRPRCSVGAQ